MRKVTLQPGSRPWSLGPAEGLGMPVTLLPGVEVEVSDTDLQRIQALAGARKLRVSRAIAESASATRASGKRRGRKAAKEAAEPELEHHDSTELEKKADKPEVEDNA